MKAQNKEAQNKITPQQALELLLEGNTRFIANQPAAKNLTEEVKQSASGQYPFATILSCIDSRVSTELIFDQGIGDLFNAKVAGNAVNGDVIGSLEYACHFAGSKLLLVLGHTKCGAITSACQNVEFGNITSLLKNFEAAKSKVEKLDSEAAYVDAVAKENVVQTIAKLKSESPALTKLENEGNIQIVGAMYDVTSGKVELI